MELEISGKSVEKKNPNIFKTPCITPTIRDLPINFPTEINSENGEDFGRIYLRKLSVEAKKDLLARERRKGRTKTRPTKVTRSN